MRRLSGIRFAALILCSLVASQARAGDRLLTFVFGPGSATAARDSARSAAGAARDWMRTPNSDVELRRAGSADAQSPDPRARAKDVERAFIDAALQSRDADPAGFLTALDTAVQAAALHPGTRLVAAVLNSPPLSSDAERTLEQLVEYCRANAIRVIVLDNSEQPASGAASALQHLATNTGGVWVRRASELKPAVVLVSKSVAPAPQGRAAAAAQSSAGPAVSDAQGAIPVYTRFIRTSATQTMSTASMRLPALDQPGPAVSTAERPYEANEATGPMRGIMIVETPLSALKFETDANADTYTARARVVAVVRDSKGAAVWSARKEVNIRGPLRKLAARRAGSLFFLRGLMLPGGESYSLEATTEDLLAGTAGARRAPLRTGKGAPGLMASDAMFVRRFTGSADRFEADQVLSYEGEALSPVLAPAIPPGEPVDLRLFFVLYPDINGAQPELSMEVSRNGRVVARVPLQFKTALRNTAQDGKFGTLAGKDMAFVGGRMREFPYLADIKGAKFSPGDYEGVLSIRQGRYVITREVAFRVEAEAAPPPAGQGGGLELAEAEVVEAVVLPAIEPATVDSSGLAMTREEQVRLWDEAARNALGYLSSLPNFRCIQETNRFTAPVKSPDQLKGFDSFKDELMYEAGKETYRTFELNGTKREIGTSELKGVHSRGEFGSMLKGLFDPEAKAAYKWAGRAMAMGVLCQVFEVEVAKANSNLTLMQADRRERVSYAGRLFVDEETGLVRKLAIQGSGLPKDFALQSPAFSLEYGMVRIGAGDYLLPLRSVLQVQQKKKFVRNETVFRNYRKFEAETDIRFK